MNAEAAAWVRDNVWTQSMRKTHREVPTFYIGCPCKFDATAECGNDRHTRCGIPAGGFPWWAALIATKTGRVASFAQPYEHPTFSATGGRCVSYALVWMADRVCRRVCPCSCHASSAAVPEPRREPRPTVTVQLPLFEEVA